MIFAKTATHVTSTPGSIRRRYAGGVTLILLLTACGGSSDAVQWKDYAPTLQHDIDALATTKDCTSLQTEFDQADANNNATMTRVGHNNAKLMTYINDKMRAAGCVN